jgi:Cd2+/Zn2+-exporting ATPase
VKKLKLDLELVLPGDAASCDACVERVLNGLRGKPGLSEVHVDDAHGPKPRLCLHYAPGALSLEQLRADVKSAGASLATRYDHVSVPVSGLRHERHARLVESTLAREPGVAQASVTFGTRRVVVELEPGKSSRGRVWEMLSQAGLGPQTEAAPVEASKEEHDDHDHDHGGPFGDHSELVFSLACGAATFAGWATERFGGSSGVALGLFIAGYVLGSWYTAREVFVALRARRFEIDFLMLIAAAGAAAVGKWFEGSLLLFLFNLGHSLEGFAMGRARKAIEALTKLVPPTALLVEGGTEREVPLDRLVLGATVRVKPNTRIPADGIVERGTSSVDQAPITGESVPVDKWPPSDLETALAKPNTVAPEHRVFAGTINGASELIVRVTKVAADSTLARVVKLVSEAQTQKSRTQLFTDRFERLFVPLILFLVVLLMFACLVIDEPFEKSFYRAMAVLVAASPCALAIATPSAVLAGVARAARDGVLVKGGAHLEELGAIDTVAFDKTGTLTEGKPTLTDVNPAAGTSERELLEFALAVEKRSDHPLANAIVTGAAKRLGAEPTVEALGAKAIIGFGIEAVVAGELVRIGKPRLFQGAAEPYPLAIAQLADGLIANGRTVMVVQRGTRFLGVLGVMDTPRASALKVVGSLKRLGLRRTVMLSGDNQRVAEAVAKQVGVDEARGDLLPEDKVRLIDEMVREGRRVAMVGDGVNDAPAMAAASVGVAMGAGGSDVALETADVALMADDLHALPFAMGLSRAARRIIRQNLWASLGMVAILIPATIFDFASMGGAVALHEGSTLIVVGNALRLLVWRASPEA